MPATKSTCPLTRRQIVDRYFLEHRAKLIDVAAFLDRLDRARDEPVSEASTGEHNEDPRIVALHRAMAVLTDGRDHRARRILEVLSDPTREPVTTAGTKGATGAPANNPPTT